MTSPNVKIHNLIRKYVKESNDPVMFNDVLHQLTETDNSSKISEMVNLALEQPLQTLNMYNFHDEFIYDLDFLTNNTSENEIDMIVTNTIDDQLIDDQLIDEYIGDRGMLYCVYGAELVTSKWILYYYIISKLNKSLNVNSISDCTKINSLHLGYDDGSVQSSLNHLFYSSITYSDTKIQWKWLSLQKNKLTNRYKKNIITGLPIKAQWDQCHYFVNAISEIHDKFNLIIFQLPINYNNIRNIYVYALTLIIRFIDTQGILLLELRPECQWTILEFNVICICALLFQNVHLTKYDLDKTHYVLVCGDKKKKIQTSSIIKKMLKILYESSTSCLININSLPKSWILQIKQIITNPESSVSFDHIINTINSSIKFNEHTLF